MKKKNVRNSKQIRPAANTGNRIYTLCRYPMQGAVEFFNFKAKNHANALLAVSEKIQDTKDSDRWVRIWVRCNEQMNYIYDWSSPHRSILPPNSQPTEQPALTNF